MSKPVTYLLVGGGSGGHLAPLIPIAQSIKKLDPDSIVIHIGQSGDKLNEMLKSESSIDKFYTVTAGKFRRYNGESFITRLFDIKTNLLNLRDFFKFIYGIIQSYLLIRRLSPNIVFTKGGFVCAPVGIASRLRNVPYVTHDSDAMVSLAHRIISKKAVLHLTAMPVEYYAQYPEGKTRQVGIPVRTEYIQISDDEKEKLKEKLRFNNSSKILLVVGGGLGARNINNTVIAGSSELLLDTEVVIVHITGHKLYDNVISEYEKQDIDKNRVVCLPFTNKLYLYSAVADVVISRAGATNMAELSAQAKACIIVPNPLLAGGHQLKNAEVFEKSKSAIIVHEDELSKSLIRTAIELLNDKLKQKELSTNLKQGVILDASDKIAKILTETASNKPTSEVNVGGL